MIPQLLISIDVPDLAVAERFYTEAFPFLTPARRFGGEFLELVGPLPPIYLLVKPAGSSPFPNAPAHEARRYTRHWTPVHLDIVVAPDELEPARDRAIAAGATLEREIVQYEWGRLAYFADPFGNGSRSPAAATTRSRRDLRSLWRRCRAQACAFGVE